MRTVFLVSPIFASLAATLALSVIGCSDGVDGADKVACTTRATAYCQKLDTCVMNGVTADYGDEATCESRVEQDCLDTIHSSNSGSTASIAQTCADALPQASCADFDANIVSACEPQAGKLGTGKACGFSDQCISGYCQLPTGKNCGSCANLSQPGDTCASTDCSQGLVCAAAQCQPPGAAQATCDDSEPCGTGLTCVTMTGATSGTCEADGESVGAACDPAHVANPDCDDLAGLFCDSTTMMCAKVSYAGAGQQCGMVAGTQVDCDNASSCVNGMCVGLVKEGAACSDTAGPSCMSPARCISGTCELPGKGC